MLSYETNENFTSILFPLYVFKFREESITKFITYGNRSRKGTFISIIAFEIRGYIRLDLFYFKLDQVFIKLIKFFKRDTAPIFNQK